MSIREDQLARVIDFGYTEVEARFLYLAATHSGYFTVRQFLDFAMAKSGKRNARLVEKLFGLGHASAQRYPRPVRTRFPDFPRKLDATVLCSSPETTLSPTFYDVQPIRA